jgi:hypothetical protein
MPTDTTQAAGPQVIEGDDDTQSMAQELSGDDGGISIQGGGDEEGIAIDASQDFRAPLLRPGEYNGVITRCEYKKSENSGQPMLTGIVAVQTDGDEDLTLPYYLSFSPKALSQTMTAIKTAFADVYNQATVSGFFMPKKVADDELLVNRPVRVRVVINKYQGEERNSIQRWLKPKQGGQAYA